jgi:hypothetical protein
LLPGPGGGDAGQLFVDKPRRPRFVSPGAAGGAQNEVMIDVR